MDSELKPVEAPLKELYSLEICWKWLSSTQQRSVFENPIQTFIFAEQKPWKL